LNKGFIINTNLHGVQDLSWSPDIRGGKFNLFEIFVVWASMLDGTN